MPRSVSFTRSEHRRPLSFFYGVAFALLAAASVHAQAQLCTPGQCTTKSAGQYFVELSGCSNTLDLYIYDRNMQPVRSVVITGFVDFLYPDESVSCALFSQYHRTNFLSAKIPAPGFFNCRITLVVGGERIYTNFDNECLDRAEAPSPGVKPDRQ